MKKLIVALLVFFCVSILLQAAAESAIIDTATPIPDTASNNLSEVFEQEDNHGSITFAEPVSIETHSDRENNRIEPFVPDGLEKITLGLDDRITVTNTSQYPYSAIAYMKVTGRCGCPWECTGFMVYKNILLTAAHCMVCSKHGEWADQVTFYFGYRNRSNYLYKYNGVWNAYAGTLFPNGYDRYAELNDWCVVKLNKNVGDVTGYFGLHQATDSEINSHYYKLAGYRHDLLKYDTGFAKVRNDKLMIVYIDALPGNSGSPIFTYDYYAEGLWTSYNETENYGHRISDDLWDYLKLYGLGL